jgi:signal peptidase I
MKKIECAVKLEGYDEIKMEFLTVPNRGDTIVYNDETFEIKVISHIVVDTPPETENDKNNIEDIEIEKTEQKKILIHASKSKRL